MYCQLQTFSFFSSTVAKAYEMCTNSLCTNTQLVNFHFATLPFLFPLCSIKPVPKILWTKSLAMQIARTVYIVLYQMLACKLEDHAFGMEKLITLIYHLTLTR